MKKLVPIVLVWSLIIGACDLENLARPTLSPTVPETATPGLFA